MASLVGTTAHTYVNAVAHAKLFKKGIPELNFTNFG